MNLRPIEFMVDAFTNADQESLLSCPQLSDFIQKQVGFYQKVLAKFGNTQVLCSVFIQGGAKFVPEHAKQKNQGWLTAEYQMLPHATHTRQKRESRGQISGRSQEIQRLIGRSLRAALDLSAMNGLNITVDCDVLHADGGTRTTAINGSFLALALALKKLSLAFKAPELFEQILKKQVAAISVGMLAADIAEPKLKDNVDYDDDGDAEVQYIIDLNYEQDSQALVDANVILAKNLTTSTSKIQKNNYEIVEIQASAEGKTFSHSQLQKIIELAEMGIRHIQTCQEDIVNSLKKN